MRGPRGAPQRRPGSLLVPLVKDAIRSVAAEERTIDIDLAFLEDAPPGAEGEADREGEADGEGEAGGEAPAPRGQGGRRSRRRGRRAPVRIDVFTLFPQWFEWFRGQRHVANVLAGGSTLEMIDIREHTPLPSRQVDDTPFGGGAGMLLRVDVLDSALRGHYGVDPERLRERRRVVALAPSGRLLDDRLVDELAAEEELTLLCGRYEGFDERILEHFASDVVSIGRYVLSGGELPAMVLCDAVLRKLPGALGDEHSAQEESYSAALEGLPEYPHYTRPADYRGWRVPEVLLSGHHERIEQWRREQSRPAAPARRTPRPAPDTGLGPELRAAAVRYHLQRALSRTLVYGQGRFPLMSSVIEKIERAQLRRVPSFSPGDRVKVHFQVIEGSRRRVQVFEGVVIKRQGHGARETFTVRKQSFGVGVERMFPVHSPKIERIELAARRRRAPGRA